MTNDQSHVLLDGDDRSVRVVEELRGLGVHVVGLCSSQKASFARAACEADVKVVIGDPASGRYLRAAGVEAPPLAVFSAAWTS